MTNISKLLILSLIGTFLFFSCEKNDYKLENIDPDTQPSELSRALLIENAINHDGAAPAAMGVADLSITNAQSTALVTSDNYLFLPFIYNPNEEILGVYLQIEGADNYWEIPFTPQEIGERAAEVLSIGIPANVIDGQFFIDYELFGESGSTGNFRTMATTVELPQDYCGDGVAFPRVEGEDGVFNQSYSFGDEAGFVTIEFNTFTVPDRLDLRYDNQWIRSTGQLLQGNAPPIKECRDVVPGDGFLGQRNSFKFYYDPGVSKKVDVYVSGCLDGGTAWEFEVTQCPDPIFAGLPDCPCEYTEDINGKEEMGGEWYNCNSASGSFHYGATYEVRWYMADGDMPGQQCTYDDNKKLITAGIAAGSPDVISPRSCEFISTSSCLHFLEDVLPWGNTSLTFFCGGNNSDIVPCWQYLENWPANKGSGCTENVVTDIQHMRVLIGEMNCKEATLLIKSANEDDEDDINANLKSYLLGRPASLTNTQLITHLQNWKAAEQADFTTDDDLVALIDVAIANLQ